MKYLQQLLCFFFLPQMTTGKQNVLNYVPIMAFRYTAMTCSFWPCISSLGLLEQSTTHWVAYTTEIYCLTDLEDKSTKSRCWQSWFLLRAMRKDVFWATLVGFSKSFHIVLPLLVSPCPNFPFSIMISIILG